MNRSTVVRSTAGSQTSPSVRPLRIAVVGCGAVTRANLLPVLAGHTGVTIVALVDRAAARARDLAEAYQISRVETDLENVVDAVDAVVLATPPAHHAPATIDLASRGKHVFVEKPMATSIADAEAMVAAAESANVALAVGLYRRTLPAVRLLRALLEGGDYGAPIGIDAEEGGPYGWQLASLDGLTRTAGGGGVLIDIGSHVIDLLLSVLPGEPVLQSYEDNARGGIETDCVARFAIELGGRSMPVRLELSRTHELRNSIRVRCERATLELLRSNFTQIVVHPDDQNADAADPSAIRLTAGWSAQTPYVGYQAFHDEIDDWVQAIGSGTAPMLSGRSVLPTVRLIEDCYTHAHPIEEPWTDEGMTPAVSDSPRVQIENRRRVLVNGAGGFLGGRAVELLRDRYGWDPVALVRTPAGAARLARWPHEIRVADVCAADEMTRALEGCDAVVHCAVGTSWPPEAARRVTIEGTRTAAEAARRAGVRRFVHISTLFVHRRDGSGVLDESAPLEPLATDDYGQAKLQAERALGDVARRGLSTVILRPVRIYGPFSKTFTIRPLQALASGDFALRGDPDVPANMVYVDNVVEAIARALAAPDQVSGSAYLVADAEQVALREFYEYFARTAGLPVPVIAASASGSPTPRAGLAGRWVAGVRTIATSPQLRAFVRRVLDTDPIGTLPRRLWEMSPRVQQSLLRRFGADAAVIYRPAADQPRPPIAYYGEPRQVSIAKAQAELGFAPHVSRERAMALTLEWARYARLLPAPAVTS